MTTRSLILSLTIPFVLMVLVLGFVWQQTRKTNENDKETDVTVLLFSGMPDPICDLAQDEAAQLEKRTRNLPSATGAEVPNDGLGYRGVIVNFGSMWVRFFEGVVYSEGFSFEPRYLDPNRELEKRILANVRTCIGDKNWEVLPVEVRE